MHTSLTTKYQILGAAYKTQSGPSLHLQSNDNIGLTFPYELSPLVATLIANSHSLFYTRLSHRFYACELKGIQVLFLEQMSA